jgi:hypothetical protein
MAAKIEAPLLFILSQASIHAVQHEPYAPSNQVISHNITDDSVQSIDKYLPLPKIEDPCVF